MNCLNTISSLYTISDLVANYLDDEPDFIFRHTKIQQVFSQIISEANGELSSWLDWRQRPRFLQDKITKVFEPFTRTSRSTWGLYNGSSQYKLCGINEKSLLEVLIREAPPTRRDVYVLDVGAGNFQCGLSIARFIDDLDRFPPHLTIHIISVRGEKYEEPQPTKSKRCITHHLGGIKIEEISLELQRLGLEIEGCVDMVMAHWCLRHLTDPVGTFAQIFNFLRPGTGMFSFDGFFLLHEEENWHTYLKSHKADHHVFQLLLDTGAPFLMRPSNLHNSLSHFILRRPDAMPCPLPMQYQAIHEHTFSIQNESKSVVRFKRTERDSLWEGSFPDVPECAMDDKRLYGSRSLFKWLEKHGLLPMDGVLSTNRFHSVPPEWVPVTIAPYIRRMKRLIEREKKKRETVLQPV